MALALAFSFTINAQKEVKREYWNLNQKIMKSETPYKDGKIHGVQKFYGEWGRLEMEIPFKDGMENGEKKEYFGFDNKKLKKITTYVNGKLNGVSKVFNSHDELTAETFYLDGKKNGIEKKYNNDGELTSETIYLEGKKNGIEKTYNNDGKLTSETIYLDDKKHGLEKLFSQIDGILITETNWQQGKKQGIQKTYDWVFSQKLQSETPFVDDKEDGVQINFNTDGTVWGRQTWANGIKTVNDGGIKKPDNQDSKSTSSTTVKGVWVQQYIKKLQYVNYNTQNVLNDDGKLVTRTTVGDQENTVLEYEGEVVNGKREGKGKLYSYPSTMKDDIILYIGDFKNGLPNGYGYLRPLYSKKIGGNPDKEQYQIGFWKNGFYVGPNANWVKNVYDNGDTFEGEIENGKMNGKGKYTWKNKNFVITQTDGSTTYVTEYSGGWKNNNLHGQGRCYYGDSTFYDGDFVNGKREGKGELTLSYLYMIRKQVKLRNMKTKTESLFKGEWKDDKFIKPIEY